LANIPHRIPASDLRLSGRKAEPETAWSGAFFFFGESTFSGVDVVQYDRGLAFRVSGAADTLRRILGSIPPSNDSTVQEILEFTARLRRDAKLLPFELEISFLDQIETLILAGAEADWSNVIAEINDTQIVLGAASAVIGVTSFNPQLVEATRWISEPWHYLIALSNAEDLSRSAAATEGLCHWGELYKFLRTVQLAEHLGFKLIDSRGITNLRTLLDSVRLNANMRQRIWGMIRDELAFVRIYVMDALDSAKPMEARDTNRWFGDIIFDHGECRITRTSSISAVNSITLSKSLFQIFLELFKAGRFGTTRSQLVETVECSKQALSTRLTQLRNELIPLEITVPLGEYRLADQQKVAADS
jgi:hypothetical protein